MVDFGDLFARFTRGVLLMPRRYSLKARLHVGTMVLVLTLVFVLAGLNLHRSIEQTFTDIQERAQTNADQVRDFVAQRMNERITASRPRPRDLEESKAAWTRILREDLQIPQLLQKALSNSHLVVDILITGADGRVITASNPAHAGGAAPKVPDYTEWQRRPLLERVWEVFTKNQEYAILMGLGAPEENQAIFTIRVLISAPLIAAAIMPEVKDVAYISLAAIAVSLLYAYIFSNLMLRPLVRVGETIDRIAAGELSADPLRVQPESQEFADLQSKLGVLGRQVRGARQDADQLRGKIDQLLQRMEEVILLFDDSERLVMAGRPAERIFGRPRVQLIGAHIKDLFPDFTPIGSSIAAAAQFKKPLTDVLVRHRLMNGDEQNFLLSVDWNADQLLVTLRDAESRKALASHLDLSARLASISRLTGGVAHEIKNPLNAIAINLEVLRARLDAADFETKSDVEVIAKEIARLDRVVKTFLNFTRPVDVKLTLLDLGEILREIGQLVEVQAKRTEVHVNVMVPDRPIHGWADPDLLKQALLNIVVNGIESMPDGGPLFLRLVAEGGDASLEVEDRGGGVPEDAHEKVFQLYFTTKENGSGIGLAVAYQAVQLMGGMLAMRSQPGAGTLFRIVLPAVEVELPPVGERSVPLPPPQVVS